MEQLPPKAPISMAAHNWPSFPLQMMPAGNSWMDEFLDFSATRRGAHRRTVSDPIAFVEDAHNHGFDRLDDEQLRSMFSDDLIALGSSSNPSSTPSDQNSDDDDKRTAAELHRLHPKPEPGEVDSSGQPPPPQTKSSDNAPGDPKRIKRILANRQSAQRSRVRKLQYISELERSVTTLQTEVSALSPRVAFLDHQRLLLNVDNSAIKQRIAALAQDKIFKDAHQEALKKEIERLRKVFHEQNMKKNMESNDAPPPAAASPPFSKRGRAEEE
ncbi:basic leucine zipper 61-like [Salvia miltiorrhiza]|uniref:basic leucine zipper 61-like n=1 Tax=Salvia miltiorrhiza TaxID=226208 RepID=UPI0025AD1FBC|nr:basic leucine zipper 61-like [Salvia miltiorrhiza]